MIVKKYSIENFDNKAFYQEIPENLRQLVNFQHKESILTVWFNSETVPQAILDEFQTYLDNHNHEGYRYPVIYDYLLDKSIDLLAVDHYKDLTVTPRVKETYGTGASDKGLLLKKEYFADDAHQILLFYVDYDYIKSQFGHLTHQKVIVSFVDQDGNDTEFIKDKGFCAYSPKEGREATRKRREAVIFLLEESLISLLSQAPGGEANLVLGAQFMEAASPAISGFMNSGLKEAIETFVSDGATISQFDFLMMELAPGYTVSQFIIDGVTYD